MSDLIFGRALQVALTKVVKDTLNETNIAIDISLYPSTGLKVIYFLQGKFKLTDVTAVAEEVTTYTGLDFTGCTLEPDSSGNFTKVELNYLGPGEVEGE